MRMKQTRYLQDDSEIRTKTRTSKTQTLNCKPDQAQLHEELKRKITIKTKYTVCRKILTRRTKLRGQ